MLQRSRGSAEVHKVTPGVKGTPPIRPQVQQLVHASYLWRNTKLAHLKERPTCKKQKLPRGWIDAMGQAGMGWVTAWPVPRASESLIRRHGFPARPCHIPSVSPKRCQMLFWAYLPEQGCPGKHGAQQSQAVTVASQGLDRAPRGTEVLLQLTRILVCVLFLQHAVMQKPRLVFKQLVYVTANTSQ